MVANFVRNSLGKELLMEFATTWKIITKIKELFEWLEQTCNRSQVG
jgi:hypothetical protein